MNIKKQVVSRNYIPKNLVETIEVTKKTIEMLKIILKLQQGKKVKTLKGLRNNLKYYLLGYIFTSDVEVLNVD